MNVFYYDGLVVHETMVLNNGKVFKALQDFTDRNRQGLEFMKFDEQGLEPLISDTFKIGDKVESVLKRHRMKEPFRGVITAFELATNRAVCKSGQAEDDGRTRYAYAHDEIKKSDTSVVIFDVGFKYKLNQEHIVISAVNPFDPFTIQLVFDNGQVECVKPTSKRSDLMKKGIYNVQKMKP